MEDDRAVFGLPNETHRARCRDVQGEIETALSEHFGRPVALVLVVDDGVRRREPAPAGPVSRPGPEPQRPPTGVDARREDADGCRRGMRHDESDDLSAFDESEMGEIADIDNSAEARVLQAFPGAEEVG